jgi:hypothetical protein
MTKELTTGFDYESVDKDTAGKLAYYAERGHKLMKASQVRFIAEMGEILSEAQKELANHKSGTFITWAMSEFDIGKQTVYNYVNAWDRLLSKNWTIYQNLSKTAIYLLTAEDTPAPVMKKVEHLAAQNEPVRKADVQRLIDASKPKPKPPAPAKPPSKTPEQVEESSELMREVVETAKATAQRTGQPVVSRIAVDHDEPEVSEKSSASIVWDALDREIPQKFRAANELSITLMSVGREVDKFRQRAKELSEQPGGEWIRLQEIDEHVRALKGHFQEARYHTVCHQCKGKGCQKCEQNGWVPEFRKNTVL